MIYFSRNKENVFVVVASDRLAETIDDFLFVFTDETTNDEYEITLTDLSDFPKTFNKFSLNIPDDIDFKHNGDYLFKVYNPVDEKVLTVGRMRLDGDKIERKSYDKINVQNKVYER